MKIGMHPVALVCFIACIVIGLWDFGAVLFGGVDASLSHWVVLNTMGEKAVPYFPPLSITILVFGLVFGHLLFPMRITVEKK